jgi:DNA-binding NarL/FixJ family response regulator
VPAITRILLIDDHSLFREAIARLLGGEPDFQVVGECATVEEGIRLLREANADVVLLDMTLPGLSGPETFSHMRALRPEVKVVFTTAYSHETLMSALAAHDSFGFVRKPYHLSDLLDSLGEAGAATTGGSSDGRNT